MFKTITIYQLTQATGAKGWKHWSLMTTKDGKQIGGCE